MKKIATVFLRVALCLLALGVFSSLLWFPQTEGRAVGLDLINIYSDPFIIAIYVASLPFFYGLFQAFTLVNLLDTKKAFSPEVVNTLTNMRYAALTLIGLIVLALIYLRFFLHGEDVAGPTMLGLCLSLVFGAVAVATRKFQRAVERRTRK